jgi:hypothetical protein
LLRRLVAAGIEFVVIGGVAVGAHGVIRGTKDLDLCPSPSRENLGRLASLLRELDVSQVGVDDQDFSAREMPFDPTRVEDLAEGDNPRLETPYGIVDVMQRIPGIDADHAFESLAADAQTDTAFGVPVTVCSLEKLRQMKPAAGRPQDLVDLANLAAAHPETGDSHPEAAR